MTVCHFGHWWFASLRVETPDQNIRGEPIINHHLGAVTFSYKGQRDPEEDSADTANRATGHALDCTTRTLLDTFGPGKLIHLHDEFYRWEKT